MALSDLLVKVGIDSSGFRSGISDLRSQSASLRASMAQMAGTIRDQVKELNAMARAGKTGTDEFKKLEQQIKGNEAAFKGMTKEARYLDKQLQQMEGPKIGNLLGGISLGSVAAFAGIASAGEMFKSAIKNASDLSETIAKTGVIFGDAQAQVSAFAEGAATAIGQSTQQAMDAATTFGVFGKAAGLSGSNLATFSTDFVKLASDMASFSNTTPEQAITAIGAALRGESEPIRQYGVLLNDAEMRQKAMALGIYDGNGALTSQQKILAAQALIYEQTKDAQGDFSRTSEGLANQQRILAAEFTNLSAQLGNALVPAANAGIKGLLGIISAAKALPAFLSENAVAIGSITAALVIYNGQLVATRIAAFATVVAEKAAAAAKWLSTAAQTALNAAMTANPLGLILKGISLLVAGFGIAYNSSEKFRAAIAGIGSVAMEMFKIIKETLGQFIGGFKMLLSGDVIGGLKSIGTAIIKGNPIGLALTEGKRLAGAFKEGYDEKLKSEKTKKDAEGAGKDIAKSTAKGIEAGIPEIKKSAGNAASSAVQEIKTAADVFGGVLGNISMTEEYYAIIGDDLGMLQAQHRDLESGMRAAWEAGGYGAANYVLELKRQRDETQKLMDGLKEMQKAKWETPAIASTGQRISQSSGGMQLPGLGQFNIMQPLIGKMQEEMAKANLLQAAFGDVDMIATEMNSLGQLISEGLEAGLDQSALQGYIDRWKELNAEQAKQAQFANLMTQVGDAAFNAFQAVGSGAQSASEGVQAFGKAAVSASLDAARAALVEAVMNNTKWLTKTMGPLGIPIALAGIGALFGLMKGAIGKSKGVQLAKGGIISGRTMAEVGEYPGAAFNPEVVAPLDKLQAMLDIGGSTHVTGTFRVQGSDLVLALDNAQRKMNQFRV